jgi:hydroxymethylglutaryl-CoA lyase
MGVFEVAVSDTIGVAHRPGRARARDAAPCVPAISPCVHDTRGMAVANVWRRCPTGSRRSSAGGLGGCPFAPGATGNLATEDLVYALHGLGIATGIDLEALVSASLALERVLGRPLPSRYLRAAAASRARAADGPR